MTRAQLMNFLGFRLIKSAHYKIRHETNLKRGAGCPLMIQMLLGRL